MDWRINTQVDFCKMCNTDVRCSYMGIYNIYILTINVNYYKKYCKNMIEGTRKLLMCDKIIFIYRYVLIYI